MKKIVVFLTQTSGHHLEYLNHIFNEVCNFTSNQYIFILPESFHQKKDKFIWKENTNSSFIFFRDKEICEFSTNKIIRSFQYNQFLKNKIKYIDTKDIFLIELMKFLPFPPFFFSKRYNISGIIYHIYLYKWKQLSSINKIRDVFKFLIFTKLSCFKSIYVLNDKFASKYFNKIYKTEKFKYLCDPVMPIATNIDVNYKEKLNIPKEKKVILHFGSLTETKGTIDILNFIDQASSVQLDPYFFIFAGVVKKDIKEEFYRIIKKTQNKVGIITQDEFLNSSSICNLFKITDVVFCPYKRIYQSSGVIGYCANFKKPALVPKHGFLGKIVKHYNLGSTFSVNSTEDILNGFEKAIQLKVKDTYLKNHQISFFCKTIMYSL